MAKTKISEFSSTPGNNTDIDGINIAEGCAPSGINDAIRELMAQLKDFQAGDAGDSITVVGTLAAKGTSSSGADLKLYEDTDNGTNYVGFIAPASIASNIQWTLPSADGSSGQALQTNGSGTLSFATLGISAGGTGQTTANAAFNALAPSQTSNAGRYLKTDGTNTSWDLLDISTADITGTLPVANGGTGLTSFTANGVVYASSSSALTTGSALTFDGTNLGVNCTATNFGANYRTIEARGATTTTSGVFRASSSDSSQKIDLYIDGGVGTLRTDSNHPLAFAINNAEQMRLTSTGLGIGTSSPAYKLDVSGNAYASNWYAPNTAFTVGTVGGGVGIIGYGSTGSGGTTNTLLFQANGEKMRLDSSGNLGLGVTPSAWEVGQRAFDFGITGTLKSNTATGSVVSLGNNCYYDSGSWRYKQSSQAAALYDLRDTGEHRWYNAPSGTAGNAISFTQAMTLSASGFLGVGTTSPTRSLSLDGGAGTQTWTGYQQAGTEKFVVGLDASGNPSLYGTQNAPMIFYTNNAERARITSGGNLGVGESNPSTARLFVTSDGSVLDNVYVKNTNTSAGTNNSVVFVRGSNTVGTITTTLSATAYNTSSDYRLKNITGPVTGSGEFIDALKPKVGTWKADGSKFVGFIAHEVQEVSPGSVVGTKDAVDEEGKPIMQAMEYGSAEFIANIIAELQSLRARVAQLEAK